ncbi:S-layer homology domain-containing protein [Bacillus sp. 37MA]|uniref:S-layer homology domain-containing protein n=1 Tax=Bacillus sp. 37MA TaxID=1132442 RepID=UPI00037B15EE|nr:S-layer homology domain-containing protein [Bacillus sp. 37MA]
MGNKKHKMTITIAASLILAGTLGIGGGNTSGNDQYDDVNHRVYAAQISGFKDVAADSFANEAILSLTGKNIIMGYPNNLYKPSETVTRGQFASMLARALNLPKADSSFKDLTKKMALYDSVSRAAKAGIIKGDAKGYVKSDQNVSRADIAVMIDRAMQLKGNYNKTTDLAFTDKNSIPAYAMDSIKKMTKYGIIQGKGNNSFAPAEYADRATSAVFLYRMLNVLNEKPADGGGGTTQPPVVTPEPPTNGGGGGTTTPPVTEKDYRKMTLAEIKGVVGEFTILERYVEGGKEKIGTYDYVEAYYNLLHHPTKGQYMTQSPQEWFKDWIEHESKGFAVTISSNYPKNREIIAFNGKAYKNSELYNPSILIPSVDEVLPVQPSQTGQFLIDVMSFSPNFVTYTKDLVKPDNLAETPIKSDKDYIVNIEKAFANAPGVTVAKDGSELTYKGTKVNLSNGQLKNGSYYAPIREVADSLGLDTRRVTLDASGTYRLEIANYPLEKKEGLWE